MFVPRNKRFSRRQHLIETCIGALLLRGRVAALSYRAGLHGTLGVTRHTLALPPERRLAQPLKIAFASDFHAGPTTHPAIFDDLVASIAHEQPDLLLLGGDYVTGPAAHVAQLCERLAHCHPPHGKFAVLGNHDLSTDDALIARLLEQAGARVLINQSAHLPAPFDSVSICGMDDPWTGAPDADASFDAARAVRVLLMHSPDGLIMLARQRYDIAFAGHTHGGQITRRDGTPIVMPHGPLSRAFCYGRYPVRNNGDLIVSRGVGCGGIPLRVHAHPELVICTVQ